MASSTAPKIIGRGGAGNFRDSDIPAAETPATPDTRVVNTHASSVRSGRGGAGNINTSTPSTSTPNAGGAAAGVGAAVPRASGVVIEAPEAPKATAVGYGGRGGMGNWKVGAEEEEKRKREEEEERKRIVEEEVRRVVDGAGGLEAPGRAYRGSGREVGEEKEEV